MDSGHGDARTADPSSSGAVTQSTRVADTGLTVVYQPNDVEPVVDIIIIHGLQGHPFNTWAAEASGGDPSGLGKLKTKARVLFSKESKQKTTDSSPTTNTQRVFWPRDLLPNDCPKARISVFGYDTIVAKHQFAGAANKNSIFAHSRELINELCRHRPLGRPIIFVTHSLGGILIKESLAMCSTSNEPDVQDILESTSGVVFMGTPHRGSSAAGIGEIARKAASVLLMDTNPRILDSLALKNSDLVRSQDVFSSLWNKHNFAVKTFQEGLPLELPFKIGQSKMAKVVPDESSCLGDSRERAETLDGDHRSMCRFSASDGRSYRKLATSLINQCSRFLPDDRLVRKPNRRNHGLLAAEVACLHDSSDPASGHSNRRKLELLKYKGMFFHQASISAPAKETCKWPQQTADDFQAWANRTNIDEHFGLLQITGKPGSGKSTLMRDTLETIRSRHPQDTGTCVAAHFFNRRGSPIEHSAQGMFRSILFQLCTFHPLCLDSFTDLDIAFLSLSDTPEQLDRGKSAPDFRALAQILERFLQSPFAPKATYIIIDALDECDPNEASEVGYFFAGLARDAFAAGVWLNVCISRREHPSITVNKSLEVRMESYNSSDIRRYVRRRLELAGACSKDAAQIENAIALGSSSIFLWAVLATDRALQDLEDGVNTRQILKRTGTLPKALEDLFAEILKEIRWRYMGVTLRLFQWAVLSTDRLRVREWHHVLAFIRDIEQPPASLKDWELSEFHTETDAQLERQIRSLSRGLIEVRCGTIDADVFGDVPDDEASRVPGAGSLDSNTGDGRFVQVIHESVGEFFINNRANGLFKKPPSYSFVSEGHLAIMISCLNYINISEFDELIKARRTAKGRLRRRQSATSFMSSASSHSCSYSRTQGQERGGFSWDQPKADSSAALMARPDSSDEEEMVYPLLQSLDQTTTTRTERISSLVSNTGRTIHTLLENTPTRRFLIQHSERKVITVIESMPANFEPTKEQDWSDGSDSDSFFHFVVVRGAKKKPQTFHLHLEHILNRRFVLHTNYGFSHDVFTSLIKGKGGRNSKVAERRSSLHFPYLGTHAESPGKAHQPRRRVSASANRNMKPHRDGKNSIRVEQESSFRVELKPCLFHEHNSHAFELQGTRYCWSMTGDHPQLRTPGFTLFAFDDHRETLAYIQPVHNDNSLIAMTNDCWVTSSEIVIREDESSLKLISPYPGLDIDVVLSTGLTVFVDHHITELWDCLGAPTQPDGPEEGFSDVKASLVHSWWSLNSMAEPWRRGSRQSSTRPRSREHNDDDDSGRHLSSRTLSVKSRVIARYTALASYALNRVQEHEALSHGASHDSHRSTPEYALRIEKGWSRWEVLQGKSRERTWRDIGIEQAIKDSGRDVVHSRRQLRPR